MSNKDLEKDSIGSLIRDITKVGFMAKSEARRRIEEIIAQEVVKAYEKGRKDGLESAADTVRSMKITGRSSHYGYWNGVTYAAEARDIVEYMLEQFKEKLLSSLLQDK